VGELLKIGVKRIGGVGRNPAVREACRRIQVLGLEFQSEMLASFGGLTQLSHFHPASHRRIPRRRPDAAIRPQEPPSLARSTTAPVRAVTMALPSSDQYSRFRTANGRNGLTQSTV